MLTKTHKMKIWLILIQILFGRHGYLLNPGRRCILISPSHRSVLLSHCLFFLMDSSLFISVSITFHWYFTKERKKINICNIHIKSSQKIKPKKQRGNVSLPLTADIFKKSGLWTYVCPFLLLGIKLVKNVWKTQQPINYIGSISKCL